MKCSISLLDHVYAIERDLPSSLAKVNFLLGFTEERAAVLPLRKKQAAYMAAPERISQKGQRFLLRRGHRDCVAHLYGPAARCKPKIVSWRSWSCTSCIRPFDGAFELLGHHGYPRALDLIHNSAPKARWPPATTRWARPFLHLLFPNSQTLAGKPTLLSGSA